MGILHNIIRGAIAGSITGPLSLTGLNSILPLFADRLLVWSRGNLSFYGNRKDSYKKPGDFPLELSESACLQITSTIEKLTPTEPLAVDSITFHGTAVPVLNQLTGEITFTGLGTLYDLKMFDAAGIMIAHFPLAEVFGVVCYDSGGLIRLNITTGDLTAMRAGRQDDYHYNVTNGWWEQEGTEIRYPTDKIEPFITVWRTSTDNETVTFPAAGVNNFWINWGDGSYEHVTTTHPTHTYPTPGDYTITVSGVCPYLSAWTAEDKLRLVKIMQLGNVGWTTMSHAFDSCANVEFLKIMPASLDNVTDWYCTFFGLTNMSAPPDFTGWDTTKIERFGWIFTNWISLSEMPDMSFFKTPNANQLTALFHRWSLVTTPPDTSGIDTTNTTSTAFMFYFMLKITTPPDLRHFNMSKCTDISYMVGYWLGIPEIGDIGVELWDISAITTATAFAFNSKFATASYDKILENWSKQTVQPDVTIDFGNSTYTNQAARDILTSAPNNWIITDGGLAA